MNGSKSLTLFMNGRKLRDCPFPGNSEEHYTAKQLCDQKNSNPSFKKNETLPFFLLQSK